MKHLIAASILSADTARLGEEVDKVLASGADWIHFDVMDNHFVPNLTMGPYFCQGLRDYGVAAPLDVHLMIEPVDEMIAPFAKAGATYISFHPEATKDIRKTISLIQEHSCKVGVVLNPKTSADCLNDIIDDIDLVLIMSVYPGFGGQTFIEDVLPKAETVRALINKTDKDILLEIDGGINANTIVQAAQAGVDVFVSGSAIFKTNDYKETIELFREKAKST